MSEESASAEGHSAAILIYPSCAGFHKDGKGTESLLNPTKISGVCGRLMCCLKNEQEAYEELNAKLPDVGDYVTTKDNLKGEVQSVSVLKQLVKVIVTLENDEKEVREYKVDDLEFKPRKKKDKINGIEDEELRALGCWRRRKENPFWMMSSMYDSNELLKPGERIDELHRNESDNSKHKSYFASNGCGVIIRIY